nr:hypothetical protein [Clostridia bacterium]
MGNDQNDKDNHFLLIMIIFVLSGIIAVFLLGKKVHSGALTYYGMAAILVGTVGIIEELWKRFKK